MFQNASRFTSSGNVAGRHKWAYFAEIELSTWVESTEISLKYDCSSKVYHLLLAGPYI